MNELSNPVLIIIFGLPGTGKTTVASALAQSLDISHFNTDILRTEMGLRGQYDKATKRKVYDTLLKKCSNALHSGQSVVVDGTFYRKDLRDEITKLVETNNIKTCWIEITAPEEVIKTRVNKKREYSEADFEVYKDIRQKFETLERKHLKLDSTVHNLDDMIDSIKKYCQ